MHEESGESTEEDDVTGTEHFHDFSLTIPNFWQTFNFLASPWACCKSETGRYNEDRSRQNASVNGRATRPVLIVATGLGFATHPSFSR